MTIGDDDASLVAAARAGSHQAFESLVRRYQHSLFGFVRSRLAAPNLAEDVTQEVLVAAYRNLDQLREPARFAAWLFGIARTKVLVAHRQRARRRELYGAELDELRAPSASPTAENPLDELLAGLADDSRVVLLLRFRDGLSYREIAERLDLPPGTVGTILHRSRAKLRQRQGSVS